jgi:hypothetical protein
LDKFLAETFTLGVPTVSENLSRSSRIEMILQKFFGRSVNVKMERTVESGFCGKELKVMLKALRLG